MILYGDPKNRRVNYIVVCPFRGCSVETALIHEGWSVRPASVRAYTSHALLASALSGFGFLVELLNNGFSF
jgi:hypothetical protein